MVQLTQSRATTVDEFAETVKGRLQAMAAAHTLLSETEWEHADLTQLVRNVLLPFATPESARIEIAGPSIELRPNAAVSVGMILHELATNAAKYGAWSVQNGAVAVRWRHVRDDGGSLVLDWEERGGPAASEPEKPGFGLRYIRQSAEYDLHGKCRAEFGPQGFRCRFTLPEKLLAPKQA
jgi:two-component system CheB/CheR fusion protein